MTLVVRHLITVAEERSEQAGRETTDAVRRELSARLARLQLRTKLSLDLLACTQEQIVRACAYAKYQRWGGTRSCFDRWWPAAFAQARAAYIRASESAH